MGVLYLNFMSIYFDCLCIVVLSYRTGRVVCLLSSHGVLSQCMGT